MITSKALNSRAIVLYDPNAHAPRDGLRAVVWFVWYVVAWAICAAVLFGLAGCTPVVYSGGGYAPRPYYGPSYGAAYSAGFGGHYRTPAGYRPYYHYQFPATPCTPRYSRPVR